MAVQAEIDAQTTLVLDGVDVDIADAEGLASTIGNSQQGFRCFIQNWSEYVNGASTTSCQTSGLSEQRESSLKGQLSVIATRD
jgi:hypothetical protein